MRAVAHFDAIGCSYPSVVSDVGNSKSTLGQTTQSLTRIGDCTTAFHFEIPNVSRFPSGLLNIPLGGGNAELSAQPQRTTTQELHTTQSQRITLSPKQQHGDTTSVIKPCRHDINKPQPIAVKIRTHSTRGPLTTAAHIELRAHACQCCVYLASNALTSRMLTRRSEYRTCAHASSQPRTQRVHHTLQIEKSNTPNRPPPETRAD
jgi:hypothetical protein